MSKYEDLGLVECRLIAYDYNLVYVTTLQEHMADKMGSPVSDDEWKQYWVNTRPIIWRQVKDDQAP